MRLRMEKVCKKEVKHPLRKHVEVTREERTVGRLRYKSGNAR